MKRDNMIIKAVIPVRANSVRIKDKNIRPFAGSSLLEIKIRQLKRMNMLDGIIVHSDSDKMLALAESLGCETVRIEEYFASSAATANEVFYNTAIHSDTDIMVHVCVTSPTLKDESLESAINFYLNNMDTYDSVNSANYIKKFLFLDGKPINHDPDSHPKSQNLPDIISRTPAISIMSKQTMVDRKDNIGKNPYFFILSEHESIDIDEQLDFEFAEFVYKKMNNIS